MAPAVAVAVAAPAWWVHPAASLFAASIAETAVYPMDSVKTWLQVSHRDCLHARRGTVSAPTLSPRPVRGACGVELLRRLLPCHRTCRRGIPACARVRVWTAPCDRVPCPLNAVATLCAPHPGRRSVARHSRA